MSWQFAFFAGLGWGLAMAVTGCWLVNRPKKVAPDITDYLGDKALEQPLSEPDGKAMVIEGGTEAELKEYQEMELRGWKKLYNKLKEKIGL